MMTRGADHIDTRNRILQVSVVLVVIMFVLFVIDMVVGSVTVSFADIVNALSGGECPESLRRIIIDIRLSKAVTALAAGAGLSVSGLQMQSVFRNPLAGPYTLGVSAGASLGVAFFMLGTRFLVMPVSFHSLGIAGAAWVGSVLVLSCIMLAGRHIRDIMIILILGLMFSSAIGAIVQILQYVSDEESLKSYILWTMGSLGTVTWSQFPVLAGGVITGLVLAVLAIKPMNMLLLGEVYARTSGLNLRRSRTILFASTSLLAGSVTAFCGPIGFIGLAMPHVTRMMFATADNRILVPGTIVSGASVMLLCDIISKYFAVPVNAVTALLGIPIVIWIVLRNR